MASRFVICKTQAYLTRVALISAAIASYIWVVLNDIFRTPSPVGLIIACVIFLSFIAKEIFIVIKVRRAGFKRGIPLIVR